MPIFIDLVTIIQTFSIALGVGASTLAIINFFVAIADGAIDDTERCMMGVVYVVLRVAMVSILVSTMLLLSQEYSSVGLSNLSSFSLSQLFVLLVLFVNSMLMTAHLVPSTFGPAIQAGSWYTLGTLSALQILDLTEFSFSLFLMGFVTWIILAIGIVNGIMAATKAKHQTHH